MANNNLKNFENALKTVNMGKLEVTYQIGANPRQVTRIYVWDNGKQILNKSVSAVTKQENFEALLRDIATGSIEDVKQFSTVQYNVNLNEDGEEDETIFDEEWHKKSLAIYKNIMLNKISEGEEQTKVIENYLRWYYLSDFTLCEQWLDLKKYHKVIKLANGNYYTDSQIKMVHEVMQACKV